MKELEADVLLSKDKFEIVCLSESDVYCGWKLPVQQTQSEREISNA